MRRSLAMMGATALVLSTLALGCGDSSDDDSNGDTTDATTEETSDQSTEPSSDATAGRPTPAEISDALLTVADLDGTWEETQRQIFEERSAENPSIDPMIWCPAAVDIGQLLVELAGSSGADVEMQSEVGGGGARFMRLQAWSNADASEYLATVIEVVRICDGVEATDEIGITNLTTAIDAPTLGDESVSWTTRQIPPADTRDEKFEALGRTTVARYGDLVMVLQISDFDLTGTTELMDDAEWWMIAEAAGDKLEQLQG